MLLETKWLVDRSRFIEGVQHCSYSRYLKYHSGPLGLGIQPKGFSLNLWLGSTVHKCLEYILRECQLWPEIKPEEAQDKLKTQFRAKIQLALSEQKEEALSKGFEDEEAGGTLSFILEEQLALAEALAWGWVRACLGKFLAEYEILYLEQEIPLDLKGTNIRLMTRPDGIIRRRSDKKLFLFDFKTHTGSRMQDSEIQEYISSVQMNSGCLAAQEWLKEPIEGYLILVFFKGSRDYFENRGRKTPTKRNYSHLLYAKVTPANPPLNETLFELKGFWIDKQETWRQEFSQALEGESPIETFIRLLPLETLYEQFLEVGPYPFNSFLANQFLQTLEGEEMRWQEKIKQANVTFFQPFEDPETGEMLYRPATEEDKDRHLTKLIPRSYQCYKFSRRCSFYDLCFKIGDAWRDPLGSGRYEPREPHHSEELAKLESLTKPALEPTLPFEEN